MNEKKAIKIIKGTEHPEEFTPKDDIREGIKKIAVIWFAPDGLASRTMPNDRTFEGDVVTFLDKNNVVQIEEKELPGNPYLSRGLMKSYQYTGFEMAKEDMLKWHKDSIKRLI